MSHLISLVLCLEILSNKTPDKANISETPKCMPRKICIDNEMLLTFTDMYVLIRTAS